MKKIALFLLLFIFNNAYALDQVTFAIGEWSPYTSETNKNGKLAEKVIVESFSLEGVKVNLTYNKWSESYEQVENGQSDGTFPWYLSEERAGDFIFSDPILEDKQVFFHLKSIDFNWFGYTDLVKYKVAGTKAFSHVKELQDKGIEPIISEEEPDSFRKVLSGEVDVYPASLIVGTQTIKTLFSPEDAAKFTSHNIPMTIDNMFLLVSKKVDNGAEIVQTFNSGLMKLKGSGRYAEILSEL
jgi:polar amino acid transport system substrate-binding protein|tara:strand:+ start:224 stop:946 length:723 start_codon:yes stop_codon:yes gene_type:complete